MKKILLILSTLIACAFAVQANINVVATLPDFGLHRIERTYTERMYDFWTPDLDRL